MQRHVESRDRAKALRANLTEPERRMWNRLRANRLGVKFQRQVVIPPFIADFAARSERLIVEIDGDTHANRQSADDRRTAHLARLGYRLIRFTNRDVMENVDGVVRAILIELGRDPESPRFPALSP